MLDKWMLSVLEIMLSILLPIATAYLVAFLKSKSEQLADQTDSEKAKHYINEVTAAITTAVVSTSQTYVDTLKAKGEFTKEKQLEAFNRAKETALSIISPAAADFIDEVYGDLDIYVNAKIEETVRVQKTENTALAVATLDTAVEQTN